MLVSLLKNQLIQYTFVFLQIPWNSEYSKTLVTKHFSTLSSGGDFLNEMLTPFVLQKLNKIKDK